jgi:biotin transport system substrate-specific component
VLSALFASLTAVGALIRIPIPPVPITLQTAFVFLSGGLLGAGSGALSQCIYIGIGLLGIPVFSGGGGIGYIFDPRFGYLIGFPAAAFIIGLLTKQCLKTKFLSEHIFLLYTGVYTLGAGIIYCCGILYLLFYAEKLSMNIPAIIWSGFIIFIPAEILKIIAGAWLTVRLHRIKVLSINKEA